MKIITLCFLCLLYCSAAVAKESDVTFENAFSPHQGASALVIKTIGEAHESIHVAAYSFTSDPIADALVDAHERGVDVDVVMDKSQSQGRETRYLKSHGVPTRINYDYSIMHDKFMVIDGKTLELGSFNYTRAAENNNAENVLVVHGAENVVKDYNKQWQKLWEEAE